MNKIGLISDIHGNFTALKKIINNHREINDWICLGDIVGYNPDPNKCVRLIKNIKARTIAGNHDYACIDKLDISWFNEMARQAIRWTRSELTEKNIEYLKSLNPISNYSSGEYRLKLAHGTPDPDNPFSYILNEHSVQGVLPFIEGFDLLFIGHTHVPGCFSQDKRDKWLFERASTGLTVNINPGFKYIINVGSVGQPRDGNPEASYALFYPEENRVEIRRLEYNIKRVQEKLREHNLPEMLAHRLELGK